jgi:hypothetical protein
MIDGTAEVVSGDGDTLGMYVCEHCNVYLVLSICTAMYCFAYVWCDKSSVYFVSVMVAVSHFNNEQFVSLYHCTAQPHPYTNVVP